MSKVLFNHSERCHSVLISLKLWYEESDMSKVLFNHSERCHSVLISLKHVVRGARRV